MDSSQPPFQQSLPPVQQNINQPLTQESIFQWPPGFVLPPTPFQQAQATQVAQAAYASYLRETRNHPPPDPTYHQSCFPTSQMDLNSGETLNVLPKVANRKSPNWNHKEDRALCEAYVQRSENPIVGTGQTTDTLWFHIFEDFCKKQPGTKRTKKGLENRWTAIQADVTKWRAIMNRVARNHQSGTNMVDELGACHEVFKNDYNRDFKLFHCWEILKLSAKWNLSSCQKSKTQPSSQSAPAKATPLPTPLMNEFAEIGVDTTSLDDIHVNEDSPLPATPIGPAPSYVHSEPLARPLGRKSAKEKRRRNENNMSNETTVPNKRLSEQLLEWRTSQNNQFQIIQETNKAQFESLKEANELHAFYLLKKTKVEALLADIALLQGIGDAEEKMINRNPNFLTSKVMEAQIARFKKLQDIERWHEEIQPLEYSPGGGATRRLNNVRSNMNPCNLENRFSASINSSEQD